jgi:hypothetical protein
VAGARPRESPRTVKLCRELEALGALTFAVVAHEYQAPGWPDRYVAHPLCGGVWLEFKSEDGELSTLQRVILKRLHQRKVPAYVLRFPGSLERWDGELLATFDGASELLRELARLVSET